jgi:beta-carotene 3-hydroxylase
MEWVAWALHKYVMHGFLWVLHESHHKKDRGFFEKNDFFFFFFGGLSAYFYITGIPSLDWRLFVAIGISLYGLTYVSIHDIFIHRRLPWLKKIDHPYFKALRRAHHAHHSVTGKEDGVSFGLLWVDKKFFKN